MASFVISEVFGAVDSKGDNIFHDICRHGCLSLLMRTGWWLDETNKLLLQEYNYEGDQPIHVVVRNHRGQKAVQLLDILVQLGADLNAPDRTSGGTALHTAVCFLDHELVAWICQQPGVNLEAFDYAQQTAYQLAWRRRNIEIMDIFSKFGADCHQLLTSDSESD